MSSLTKWFVSMATIAVSALALVACAPEDPSRLTLREDNPTIVNYEAGDEVMGRAISSALSRLDYFWEHYDAPSANEEGFVLKVRFSAPSGVNNHEHMWVDTISRTDDGFAGILSNEPASIPSLAFGDEVVFTRDRITDWGFWRDGKMIGYYTTRIQLDQVPEEEAEEIRALLGENP